MKIRIDDEAYHQMASDFVKSISLYVDYHLKNENVGAKKRKELAESITFSLCSLLDGSANIPTKNKKIPVVPCLGFHVGGKNPGVLVSEVVALHEFCGEEEEA